MESTPKVSFEDTQTAFAYKSDAELRRAHFIFSLVNHPWISALAIGLVKAGLFLRLPVNGIIRKTVFNHFCGGETITQADEVMQVIARFNVRAILDYSVEGEHTEEGFEQTTQETLRTIENAKATTKIPFCVFKVTGLASAALLEKVQLQQSLTAEEQAAFNRVKNRMDRICAKGYEYGIPILIDAEDSWYQDTIDRIVMDLMIKYNREKAIVYNTYQLYRTAGLPNLRNHFHEAVMHNVYFGAKLVRGAYMEKERERAAKMGYTDPIHPNKQATDDAFNEALAFCIDNKQRISLMCGSHNDYSNYYLTVLMEKHSMLNNDPRVWFAQLYGMSDHISFNLAKAGYNVVKYLPYGPVRSVMPYLFRRAEENTSVAGQSSRELMLIRKELSRRKNSR
ncbi:MAG: proline dehydrogenase family protein [Flammeovirgaceae bacterium]|nr:MAG: proline dehydrogenase family protein [Flammeovirgaceae bacterium]